MLARILGLLAALTVASPGLALASDAAPLSGRWFGMEGQRLHTWAFEKDGAFLHETAVQGAGTSVRTSERGRFEVAGDALVLHVTRAATGYATTSAGGRGGATGAGASAQEEVRRVPLQRGPGNVLVVDGVKLKPKTW